MCVCGWMCVCVCMRVCIYGCVCVCMCVHEREGKGMNGGVEEGERCTEMKSTMSFVCQIQAHHEHVCNLKIKLEFEPVFSSLFITKFVLYI